jgi:FkbM family methyltransferase
MKGKRDSKSNGLPLAARFLRAYLRTGWRGQTRAYLFLSKRMKSLHSVPIQIADWAPVYMDLRDGVDEWLKGTPWKSSPWEVAEQDLMRRVVEAGDIVFDIGANKGLHTVLLSDLVGEKGCVHAFEPNSQLFPNLSRTVANLNNVKLYPFALSDQKGEAVLFIPNNQMMASLADWTSAENLAEWRNEIGLDEVHTVECKQISLDELISNGEILFPDFIKCDVEGAELMVFRGAQQTLNREDAPIILFEVDVKTANGFGVEHSAAANFLAGLSKARYSFFKIKESGGLTHIRSFDFAHANLLAVPQSKLSNFSELESL